MKIIIRTDWQTAIKICEALDAQFPEVDYEVDAKKSEEPKGDEK